MPNEKNLEGLHVLTVTGLYNNQEQRLIFKKETVREMLRESLFGMAKASMAIEGERVDDLHYENFKDRIEISDEFLTTQ